MKIKFSIFVIFALLLRVSVTILAEENPCIFFAPQIMNESNNIIVPVYAKNLPQNNDGLCGMEFEFAYDTEQFTLKTDESGRPQLMTNSTMLVQDTDIVDVSINDDVVSVSYIDFSGENNVVLQDGPLFCFTLIPKHPDALWNSEDYYPLRFLAGSINLITLDKEKFSLLGTPAEGIDTYVGGYNAFPNFEPPKIEDKIEFKANDKAVYINGEAKKTDSEPYVKDEFMIPIRPFAENAGMELYWDGETNTVSLFEPYTSVYFDIRNNYIYVNAKQRIELSEPEIINGRTFVPLSTIQMIFGERLKIENNGDSVSLNFNKNEEEQKL